MARGKVLRELMFERLALERVELGSPRDTGLAARMSLVPGFQLVHVVVVGAVAGKCGFVEQSLDAARQTNPVGASLYAQRPTHFSMPAATHHHDRCTGHPSSDGARPQPARSARLAGLSFRLVFLWAWVFYYFHGFSIRLSDDGINSSLGLANVAKPVLLVLPVHCWRPPNLVTC